MSTDITTDPRAIVAPDFETATPLYGDITTKDVRVLAPALVTLFVGLLVLLWIDTVPGLVVLAVAGILGVAGNYFRTEAPDHKSPLEMIADWRATSALQEAVPMSHEEYQAENPHGVLEIRPDGIAETEDGKLVRLLECESTNVHMATPSEALDYAYNVTSAFDQGINDFEFRIFSTSEPIDPEDVVGRLEDLSLGELSQLDEDPEAAAYLSEQAYNTVEWYEAVDEPPYGTHHRTFYVAVIGDASAGPADDDRGRLGRLRDIIVPGREFEIQADQGAVRDALDKNVVDAMDALSSIPGVECRQADAETASNVYAEYFTGSRLEGADHLKQFDSGRRSAEDILAPDHFDVQEDMLRVGDSWATTLWVKSWPMDPDPLFLKHLFDLKGYDVDICIRAQAEDPAMKYDELARQEAAVQVEAHDRLEDSQAEGEDMLTDAETIPRYREIIRQNDSQPWEVSMYLTIRADPDRGIRYAAETYEELEPVDIAQQAALRNDVEEIKKFLEQRCDMETVRPSGDPLKRAFLSGSPVSPDYYEIESAESKTKSMPGAVLGSMGMFSQFNVFQDGGLYLGRTLQNDLPYKFNPQNEEQPPHILTTGVTGSGKTFAWSNWLGQWYLEGKADDIPNHNLFLCDTKAGFSGLIEQINGEHVVVDGRQSINPFEILPVPENIRERVGDEIDPFGNKVDEVVSVFSAILREQDIDPGNYKSIIRYAAKETYLEAGIYPDDLDSHAKDSPTPADFIDKLREIIHHPGEHSLLDHDDEQDVFKKRISALAEKLLGLQEHGKYAHMLGQADSPITDDSVDALYIDLRQLEGASDAQKSVNLNLILGQLSQKIKRMDGETIFAIDEAHILLHSPEMVEWLQKAAREWRAYDASLLFITQNPSDFSPEGGEGGGGEVDRDRHTILEQCGMTVQFRNEKVNETTLKHGYDMNENHIQFIRDEAVQGQAGQGYSECLVHVTGKGWTPIRVEAPGYLETVLNYEDREHGDFDEFIETNWRRDIQPRLATVHGDPTNGDAPDGDEPGDEQPTSNLAAVASGDTQAMPPGDGDGASPADQAATRAAAAGEGSAGQEASQTADETAAQEDSTKDSQDGATGDQADPDGRAAGQDALSSGDDQTASETEAEEGDDGEAQRRSRRRRGSRRSDQDN